MVYGIEFLLSNVSSRFYKAALIYLMGIFLVFLHTYFNSYQSLIKDSAYNAPQELGDTLDQIVKLNIDFNKIYVYSTSFPQNGKEFIYLRFFDPISPTEWQRTKDQPFIVSDNLTERHYANYEFVEDNEVTFEDQEKVGYIIHKNSALNIEIENAGNYEAFENELYYFVYYT